IGVDIDTGEARTEVAYLEDQLRRLGAAHPNPTVRADTAAARELEDLNARLAGAQLSQRDAALSVREAQAELTRTVKDAGS
ncbi:hypothetical protein KBZ21_42200, partial [Streptomyces sp. A73]|nr:hypothetical protein [Streptomyces sp. A73]